MLQSYIVWKASECFTNILQVNFHVLILIERNVYVSNLSRFLKFWNKVLSQIWTPNPEYNPDVITRGTSFWWVLPNTWLNWTLVSNTWSIWWNDIWLVWSGKSVLYRTCPYLIYLFIVEIDLIYLFMMCALPGIPETLRQVTRVEPARAWSIG